MRRLKTPRRAKGDPPIAFQRATFALLQARGNVDEALKIAEERWPKDPMVPNWLRAAKEIPSS